MSTGRDAILGRIREALKIAAPVPGDHDTSIEHDAGHAHDNAMSPVQDKNATGTIRAWLPAVGANWEENAALFAANSADLKTSFLRVPTKAAAFQVLHDLAATQKWSRVAFHETPLIRDAITELKLPALETKSGYDVNELERCDAGITACDALIAQTGTVLLTATSAGGRTLSVLPPHHVVIATREQLLPDLSSAYELVARVYGAALPSFITLITGPSRTGDIERILVLGAHGPKKLTVVLIDE